MRFSSGLAILASAVSSINAATHQVAVGDSGLKYTPNTTIAAVGDTVVFSFYPINHNVVQGSYDTPCMLGNETMGIYSGYIPSMSGVANRTFHITINNTDPIWYYCSQVGHCTKGMVGVINPPNSTEETLESYMTAAASVNSSSYTEPSTPQYGIVVANTSSSTTPSSSGSPSTSTGAPAATSTTNAGAILGVTKLVIGAVAGGLAFAML